MKYVALVVVCCAVGLLAGCGKDESTTGTGGSLTPITVTGKVIGANKQPVSGVPVLISGIPSVNTDRERKLLDRQRGASVHDHGHRCGEQAGDPVPRADPFRSDTHLPGIQPRGEEGRIADREDLPVPAAIRNRPHARPWWDSSRRRPAGPPPPRAATGLYTLSNAEWYGPSTTTGTLHALQYDYNTTTGLPTTYVGYGVRSGIALLDATSNPNGNDTMSVVGTTSMTGSVTAPGRVYDRREVRGDGARETRPGSICCRTTIRPHHSPMRCPTSQEPPSGSASPQRRPRREAR